jgi:glycerol-3-phosphate dehydrogenase
VASSVRAIPAEIPAECDVLVVGGGINGAGIARDAAGRGLSTVLCEKDDLASHTSSASTKLIHGGLRYLEQFELRLVRKALGEREILMRAAPHVIWPLQFVMPHDSAQRPAWMIRAGLFLYDRLAQRQLLGRSHGIDLQRHPAGPPLQPSFKRGFVYADGWVDDARLVVLNALAAAEQGAHVLTRTACAELQRDAGRWQARLAHHDGSVHTIAARCVVNATGPWADRFLGSVAGIEPATRIRLVRGSHIVVGKLFDHPFAYLFQHPDGRVIFAIPYEQDFTLIGTTDVEHAGDLDRVAITQPEIDYLCDAASRYFRTAITPAAVVWSYAGVRPLQDDDAGSASNVTRDYHLQLDCDGAPLLNVFGGKLTTYRKLAEEAVDAVAPLLGCLAGAWTAGACLPGGDLFGPQPSNRAVLEFDAWSARLAEQYPWVVAPVLQRYARAYGTRVHTLLAGRTCIADLGEEVAPDLFGAELSYLMRHEWASCAEDILWRRTKRGLHLPPQAAATVDRWIATHLPEVTRS